MFCYICHSGTCHCAFLEYALTSYASLNLCNHIISPLHHRIFIFKSVHWPGPMAHNVTIILNFSYIHNLYHTHTLNHWIFIFNPMWRVLQDVLGDDQDLSHHLTFFLKLNFLHPTSWSCTLSLTLNSHYAVRLPVSTCPSPRLSSSLRKLLKKMFLKFSWGLLPNGRQSSEYMKLNELKNTGMGSVWLSLFTCWFMTQSDLLVIHTLNLEWIRTQVTITHTAHQSSALCERFFSTFCAITRTWVQPNHFTLSFYPILWFPS